MSCPHSGAPLRRDGTCSGRCFPVAAVAVGAPKAVCPDCGAARVQVSDRDGTRWVDPATGKPHTCDDSR